MAPIPFSTWMHRALYDPDKGYYTRNIRAVGGLSGDFTTTPGKTPAVASALARWIFSEPLAREKGPVHVIEAGPGEGMLARDLRRSVGWLRRMRIQCHLVETSPVLRERQRALLGKRARWHDSVADALKACGGRAFLVMNELVDAFPCEVHRLEDGGAWSQLHMDRQDGTHVETWVPDETQPADFCALSQGTAHFNKGQRVETHGTWKAWFEEQTQDWQEGSLWLCDYGDTFPRLYHRRPHGTLRAYYHHQRLEGHEVYARKGFQDITADVNFSDLQQWCGQSGLSSIECASLGAFVSARHSNAPEWLRSEHSAGGAFQVLCARKTSRPNLISSDQA